MRRREDGRFDRRWTVFCGGILTWTAGNTRRALFATTNGFCRFIGGGRPREVWWMCARNVWVGALHSWHMHGGCWRFLVSGRSVLIGFPAEFWHKLASDCKFSLSNENSAQGERKTATPLTEQTKDKRQLASWYGMISLMYSSPPRRFRIEH